MPVLKEVVTFDTLIDLACDFSKNLIRARNQSEYLDRSSIMKAKKDLILSFPVLCSDTISPDTAMMITKVIERECCTTLQLLFAANALKGRSGIEAIKQWHTNMDDKNFNIGTMDIDDYLDISDAISTSLGENVRITGADYISLQEEFKLSLGKRFPVSSFSEAALGDYYYYPNGRIVCEARKGVPLPSGVNPGSKEAFDYIFKYREDLRASEKNQREKELAKDTSEREREKWKYEKLWNTSKNRREEEKNRREERDSNIQYMKAQLLDNDVRKANELVPSLLIVRYYVDLPGDQLDSTSAVTINGAKYIEQQFIIGVKARLIPVPSSEIVSNLISANRTKVSFINFIRATTKEINFAKDFVAAIDQAKLDAKKNSKLSKTSPIWRSLQSRAVKSKVNRLLRSTKANDASAITTLVMTEEEVNIMKKEYDFDIYNARNTRFIMDNFNFMGMVVVDEAVEVTHFYLDGNDYWEDYTFSSLERETGDTSYKKIINLISKINR